MPKPPKKPMTEEWVARHLDMWIGQYFNDAKEREGRTLGEYLAYYLPKIANVDALKWLQNG